LAAIKLRDARQNAPVIDFDPVLFSISVSILITTHASVLFAFSQSKSCEFIQELYCFRRIPGFYKRDFSVPSSCAGTLVWQGKKVDS
jgi:hypothetical protein